MHLCLQLSPRLRLHRCLWLQLCQRQPLLLVQVPLLLGRSPHPQLLALLALLVQNLFIPLLPLGR